MQPHAIRRHMARFDAKAVAAAALTCALAILCPASGRGEDLNVDPKFLPSLAGEIRAKGFECPTAQSGVRERMDAFGLSIRVNCGTAIFRVTLRADAQVDVEQMP